MLEYGVRLSIHYLYVATARLGVASARLGVATARLGVAAARLGVASARLGVADARLRFVVARLGSTCGSSCCGQFFLDYLFEIFWFH